MTDQLQLIDTPLAMLSEEQSRPGPEALDRMMAML